VTFSSTFEACRKRAASNYMSRFLAHFANVIRRKRKALRRISRGKRPRRSGFEL
tara:strand:- start:113 stop:274 length:162 start_codon:yes stop_codon:yes gene_type:complete